MPKFCRQCGTALEPGDRFCGDCGTAIAAAPPPDPAPAPAPEPRQDPEPAAEAAMSAAEPETAVAEMPVDAMEPAFAGGDGAYTPRFAWMADQEGEEEGSGSRFDTSFLTAFLEHPASFFVAYVVAMIPTYVLPYFGSNSALMNSTGVALGLGALPQYWVHLTFLYVLVALAWVRGGLIGRSWLPVFPVLAGLFDMLPGFNWVPLVPTGFHVATLIIGVTKDPLPGVDKESQRNRPTIALVGLGLMVLLTAYKWISYTSNAQRGLRPDFGALAPPVSEPAPQPSYTEPTPMVSGAGFTLNNVTTGTRLDGNTVVDENQPIPPGPTSIVTKYYYSGASPGDAYSCGLGTLPSYQGTFRAANGFVWCAWPNVAPGTYVATLTAYGVDQSSREIVVPAPVRTEPVPVPTADSQPAPPPPAKSARRPAAGLADKNRPGAQAVPAVPAASLVRCILPSGQETNLTREQCRDRSGAIL